MPDMAAEPLQEFMAPIFTDPVGVVVGVVLGVGVGPGVGVSVGTGVEVGVAVGVGVGVGVAVDVGDRVGVSSSPPPPPQAANIGNIKTKARAIAINLYHILFGHMVDHLPLQFC